jgi:hypothetical protein
MTRVTRWYFFIPKYIHFEKPLIWERLVYFMGIWHISCPFGTFCVQLVYFCPFWYDALKHLATLLMNNVTKLYCKKKEREIERANDKRARKN